MSILHRFLCSCFRFCLILHVLLKNIDVILYKHRSNNQNRLFWCLTFTGVDRYIFSQDNIQIMTGEYSKSWDIKWLDLIWLYWGHVGLSDLCSYRDDHFLLHLQLQKHTHTHTHAHTHAHTRTHTCTHTHTGYDIICLTDGLKLYFCPFM